MTKSRKPPPFQNLDRMQPKRVRLNPHPGSRAGAVDPDVRVTVDDPGAHTLQGHSGAEGCYHTGPHNPED